MSIRPDTVLTAGVGVTPNFNMLHMQVIERGLAEIALSRDLDKAQATLAGMKKSLATLRASQFVHLPACEAQVLKAENRVRALTFLLDKVTLPDRVLVRDPANSNSLSGFAAVNRARALMAGYEQGVPTPTMGLLRAALPFIFWVEPTPAFHRLTPAHQKTYLAVAKQVDAAGAIALHDLLVEGRLMPALLTQLNNLSTAELHPDVNRGILLSQTLRELADPVTISQRTRLTCAPTSVQIMIALQQPELYVKLLQGLASPAGKAALPGGAILEREADWNYSEDGGRSIPSRLLQPALMELGNGASDYSNTDDTDTDPQTKVAKPPGLDASDAAPLLQQLYQTPRTYVQAGARFRQPMDPELVQAINGGLDGSRDRLAIIQNKTLIDPASEDAIVNYMKQYASLKEPIYCTIVFVADKLTGQTNFHAVLVTEVKDGMVHYIDPNGRIDSLTEEEFKGSLVAAVLPEDPQEK